MTSCLENQILKVTVNSKGAELASVKLKEDGTEYLWQGDTNFWGRRAPILFPIVGKLKNDCYMVDSKVYTLIQHGFARDMDFQVQQESGEKITFELTSNDFSLQYYPYQFKLIVRYILQDNKIVVGYNVKNMNESEMYFSIGAHPGFNCPILPDERMEDYYLEFENNENAIRYYLENGLISEHTGVLLKEAHILPLSQALFKDDAIILKNLSSHRVTLKNQRSHKEINLEYAGFPYLGIWSKPEGASFICIEPWYGLADMEKTDSNLKLKEGIQVLESMQEFNCEYCIAIK